ncbi:hypothetical protein PHYBOEH_003327 [Phytophthora boehmeriae]|uniref:RxLR effector protein n=1 Tax=Phytophthora boehmeriae TaxID=109152 RepID=A0A8T1V509_9STRA|nr:hypothetical protein PHYBOEH_003327 [Phytophthora boehmeriae]
MRLHYFLLVTAATLLAIIDAISANAQTSPSATTSTDSVSAAHQLTGALSEDNAKRSLRTVSTVDEDDDDHDDDDDGDEERGITVLSASTTAKEMRQWLKSNSVISKETSKHLKQLGLDADDIAKLYAKYVKLG